MRLVTALLILSSVAVAESPVAAITGPDHGRPGDIIILSASCADHVDWLVDSSSVAVPVEDAAASLAATAEALRAAGFSVEAPANDAPPVYLELDGGKRLLLASYSGVYRISLAVGNADGVDQCAWKVTVSGGVVPPVVVPPPIVVVPPVIVPAEFTAKLTAAIKANPSAASGFALVANTYETVAGQIKSGALTTPAQVIGLTSVLANVACPEWAAIDSAIVKPHLATLGLTTAAQHEGPWRQIAAAIKAGLTDIPPPVVVDPPLPVSGLHVLIVEEMDDRRNLPASQVSIFTSTELRKWFVENNVQWRMFDDDVDQSQLEQKWKDALARPRASLPWVTLSNGRTGFEGTLPATVADLITILEKYK